jgi:hydroxyethylthiazole kinase-like uncharacterized protein yjeF
MNFFESHIFAPVLSVAEVIALEKQIEARGTPLLELMFRAGHSVSDWIIDQLRLHPRSSSVVVFCGSGNNGGDGWVVAGDLATKGYSVTIVTALPASKLTTEPARTAALRNYETNQQNSPELTVLITPDTDQLNTLLASSALVVDAMLGTGFSGESLKDPYASWAQAINAAKTERKHNLAIVAVDVPSGLSAQTGVSADHTIVADATITMLAYKPGLLTENGRKHCGDLILAKLSD